MRTKEQGVSAILLAVVAVAAPVFAEDEGLPPPPRPEGRGKPSPIGAPPKFVPKDAPAPSLPKAAKRVGARGAIEGEKPGRGEQAEKLAKALADFKVYDSHGHAAKHRFSGKEQLLLDLSEKYRVPVDLALAMFHVESHLGVTGVGGPSHNNPGSLRSSRGPFQKFATLDEGIEAYFRELDQGYRKFIDKDDLAGLIHKYAPGSDGNNEARYVSQIKGIRKQFAI